MSRFDRFFQKAVPRGLFSFVFPQTPASVQNPEYLKAYRGWVYACVKRISTSVSTMELTLQQKSGDEWKEVSSGPAMQVMDLLTRVNPFLTSDALYRATSAFIDLIGNAFWLVVYNCKKTPSELWLLDPTKVETVTDETNFIKGYIYTTPNGRKIKLGLGEVIPFQDFNPESPYKGKGPTEAAAISIDTDRYASEWNRNFFANFAIPAIAINSEQNLTDEQYERLITSWMARFQGVSNAHKPVVLEGKMDVALLNSSQKDMDYSSLKHASRDEILAIFGVPKSVLGIVEDVNRGRRGEAEIQEGQTQGRGSRTGCRAHHLGHP